MKQFSSLTIQGIIAAVLVGSIIIGTTIMVAIKPTFSSELIQFLISLLLTALSVWLGAVISTKKAEKNAMEKWLPAAEMVCNELLTMSAQLERMCRQQSRGYQAGKDTFPGISEAILSPVMKFVDLRCSYCSENHENLKNHIENCYLNWNNFIKSNGEKNEVLDIQNRLLERKKELFSAIDRDFPSS